MSSIYLFLLLATFVYLLVDLYAVIGSCLALFKCFAFWLHWIVFTVLNAVAFVLFRFLTPKIANLDTAQYPGALLALFFTLIGTFSIIQSFSLKFANYKAIDLQQLFDGLRAKLLSDAAAEKGRGEKATKMKLSNRLSTKFKADEVGLENSYRTLMTFGGRDALTVQTEITNAGAFPNPKLSTLVIRMVMADADGAENLL